MFDEQPTNQTTTDQAGLISNAAAPIDPSITAGSVTTPSVSDASGQSTSTSIASSNQAASPSDSDTNSGITPTTPNLTIGDNPTDAINSISSSSETETETETSSISPSSDQSTQTTTTPGSAPSLPTPSQATEEPEPASTGASTGGVSTGTSLGGSSISSAPHTDTQADDDDLKSIKDQALSQLSPIVGKLDLDPEEKYKTLMMMIQASDNQDLIKDAYDAAQKITDEKAKAEALLNIVNEINYFSQHKPE